MRKGDNRLMRLCYIDEWEIKAGKATRLVRNWQELVGLELGRELGRGGGGGGGLC